MEKCVFKFGFVAFDNPRKHSDGWAAVEGERAQRITGAHALASDVIWWTNLDYSLSELSGMGSNARFRSADYLWRRPEWFLRQLGISESEDHRSTATEALAGINGRVTKLFMRLLRLQTPPLYSLRKSAAEVILGENEIVSIPIRKAFEDATKFVIKTERVAYKRNTTKAASYSFWLPAALHTAIVSEVPIARGPWKMSNGKGVTVEECVCSPCLAQISVSQINREVSSLLNFGSGTGRVQDNRTWVSSIELDMLTEWVSKIEILKVIRPTTLLSLNDYLRKRIKGPGEEIRFAFSWGIALENIWVGLGTTVPPSNPESRQKPHVNTFTPFLRAADRNECFLAARRLQKAGVSVLRYGGGSVISDCTGMLDRRLAEAAVSSRVFPEALKLSDQEAAMIARSGHFKREEQGMSMLLYSGQTQELLIVDKKITTSLLGPAKGSS